MFNRKKNVLEYGPYGIDLCRTHNDTGSEVWFEVEGLQMMTNIPENVIQYVKDNFPEHVWCETLGMFVSGEDHE